MSKVDFLVVPQQQQQQSSKEISIQPGCSKTFRQICLQHLSSILKTQPSRKGASNYYNEIWGKAGGMDDGRWVFN